MADIFISHSPLDRERVKPIVDRLSSLGHSVWWDKAESPQRTLFAEREQELNAARHVLVVWSDAARSAARVQAEAVAGLDAGTLVQARIDAVMPIFATGGPIYDLTGAGEWGPLEQALAQKETPTPSAPASRGAAPLLSATGVPRLMLFAVAAALAAYAGALAATWNGVMSAAQLQIALIGVLSVAGISAILSAARLIATLRAEA